MTLATSLFPACNTCTVGKLEDKRDRSQNGLLAALIEVQLKIGPVLKTSGMPRRWWKYSKPAMVGVDIPESFEGAYVAVGYSRLFQV